MSKHKVIKYNLLGLAGAVLLIILDQFTKYLAVKYLMNKEPYEVINDVFQLTYLENRGAAFGILYDQKVLIVFMGIVVLAGIGFFYNRMPFKARYLPLRWVCLFMFAGAIGNMIDRIRFNYVIDFFYFELIDFPVFNVADCYVTISAVTLLILFFFHYKEEDLEFLSFRRQKENSVTGGESDRK